MTGNTIRVANLESNTVGFQNMTHTHRILRISRHRVNGWPTAETLSRRVKVDEFCSTGLVLTILKFYAMTWNANYPCYNLTYNLFASQKSFIGLQLRNYWSKMNLRITTEIYWDVKQFEFALNLVIQLEFFSVCQIVCVIPLKSKTQFWHNIIFL